MAVGLLYLKIFKIIPLVIYWDVWNQKPDFMPLRAVFYLFSGGYSNDEFHLMQNVKVARVIYHSDGALVQLPYIGVVSVITTTG